MKFAAEQRPGVVVVNARNIKTSETERKLDNAGEEANEKLQEYVETIKVTRAEEESGFPLCWGCLADLF